MAVALSPAPAPPTSAAAPGSPSPVTGPPRAASIDLLRGLVMVLMTLDHARYYVAAPAPDVGDPMDLALVTPGTFWLRWLTHFCAPVFVLLAGVSARLQGGRLAPRALARQLAVRGLVLIALEFTLVDWGWTFAPLAWPLKYAQVIWAIGVGMLALAGLVALADRLPPRLARHGPWLVAAVGVAVVAGHNLLDGVAVTGHGPLRYLWAALHHKEVLPLGRFSIRTTYPVLPIIGLVACGYGLGGWYTAKVPARRRRQALVGLGLGASVLFVVLRVTNVYGDPHPAVRYDDFALSVRSVLNVTKYPLSLSFVLMTLGPSLLLLAAWDGLGRGAAWARPLALLGRVPMFYYVVHLWAVHALALGAALLTGFPPAAFDFRGRFGGVPAAFGWPLWGTATFALGTVLVLYPACAWYARLRASRRYAWTRYL